MHENISSYRVCLSQEYWISRRTLSDGKISLEKKTLSRGYCRTAKQSSVLKASCRGYRDYPGAARDSAALLTSSVQFYCDGRKCQLNLGKRTLERCTPPVGAIDFVDTPTRSAVERQYRVPFPSQREPLITIRWQIGQRLEENFNPDSNGFLSAYAHRNESWRGVCTGRWNGQNKSKSHTIRRYRSTTFVLQTRN